MESLKLALEFLTHFDNRKHGLILSEMAPGKAQEDALWFSMVFGYLEQNSLAFFIGVGARWKKSGPPSQNFLPPSFCGYHGRINVPHKSF